MKNKTHEFQNSCFIEMRQQTGYQNHLLYSIIVSIANGSDFGISTGCFTDSGYFEMLITPSIFELSL